jgi:anti-anti-sigma regulatory factor
VRLTGVLDERDALTGADHLCWVYDDPASFTDAALRYLAEGLARGERLLCVGAGMAAELRVAGEPFGSIDDLVARGALSFASVAETYADGEPVRPADQWAFYDEAVRAARADGFRGLRVVADATALADTALGRARMVEWEHLADEYIASGAGMVAMCAYHRGALDSDAVADLTAVHPQVHSPLDPPSFRVWFDDDVVHIAGTVDTFAADRLGRVLTSTVAAPGPAGPAVLDLSGLEVVDVAGCRALAEWVRTATGTGERPQLRGAPRTARRIWRLLGFDDTAPVTFTEQVR